MSNQNPIIKYSRQLSIVTLAMVFGWSGLSKMLNPEEFALALYRYHLVPDVMINILSLWIAAIEVICCGIILVVPRLRKPALFIVLGLFIAFTFALAINIMRGSNMACGCFSMSPMATPVGWIGILRNAGLTLLVIHALGWPTLNKSWFLSE